MRWFRRYRKQFISNEFQCYQELDNNDINNNDDNDMNNKYDNDLINDDINTGRQNNRIGMRV